MKIIITIAVLIFVCTDITIVDLIARYSCDRNCPQLPSFLSQGLVGKNQTRKKDTVKAEQEWNS